MSNIRTYARAFNGGEVTPEFFGQIADAKSQTGLAKCENFVVLPHGPVANRLGTAYVRVTKDSSKACRVLPFSFSTTQTMAIETGDQYFRFHTDGATLLSGSPAAYNGATAYVVGDLVSSAGTKYYCIANTTGNAPPNATYWYALPATGEYEVKSPFLEADLFDIHYVQSADVFTLVHPNYAPRELRRYAATNWRIESIAFASTLTAPTGVSATNTTGTGTTTYTYKVAAVASDGLEESLASSEASCTNDLLTTGNKNTFSWSAVSGAARYNVYKKSNGLFGYIGQTDATSFVDDNITADVGKTPPIQDTPFSSDYPGAVSYFEQRRVFAGTTAKPQNFWMTRSGTESNLSYSIPTRDDDAIRFRIAAREANTIRHVIPLRELLLLTSSAEWLVTSVNSDAITPTTTAVRTQSYVGASNVQPVIVNNTLIFASARGGHIRELGYSDKVGGYLTGDLSLRAPHLFDGYEITDMAYAKAPYPIVWATSSSGQLLGLTYIPEQQVAAWHKHTTATNYGASAFESVTVVAEGDEDAVYVVVKRYIDGGWVRYIERFASRAFDALEDAFFVDCGLTYNGAAATTISGLDHLEGETVNILADGAVHPQRVVTGGAITLDQEASKVHIGLPITADLQTLPLAFETREIGGAAQGRQKNVNKVWLRVYRSSGIFVGPTFDKLVEAKQRTTEPYGSPPDLKSEEIPVVLTPTWADSGQVCVRQSDPLPLTITSMTLEVAIGG